MITIAFGSVPKDGGTFTFYRNMRPALREHGIDMRCVAIGKEQAELWEDPYVDEGCVLLAPKTRNIKKQAMAFADWCEAEQIDIVMGINSEAILSALPHLPGRIRCMSRCANSFDHGYRITVSGYERLAAIIAQTPRQLKDLTETYSAAAEKITVIPNGIEPGVFGGGEGRGSGVEGRGARVEGRRARASLSASPGKSRGEGQPLRLGFLGRLEHKQKGVLFLPEIVRELKSLGVNFELRIAGKGRHEEKLRAEIERVEGRGKLVEGRGSRDERPSTTDSPDPVPSSLDTRPSSLDTRPSPLDPRPSPLDPRPSTQFLGALPPAEVPGFLAETDIFLFPSQFEGCPNALLEAMMAGCVPVAWKLEGITDFIIEDGVSGALVPIGDCRQFAEKVAAFIRDPDGMQQARIAAAHLARERFSTDIAAERYARVIRMVADNPPPTWRPRPWSTFRPDPNFEHSWRDYIPKSFKQAIRRFVRKA